MSRDLRMVAPATSGSVDATGASPKSERFALDYATWYARLAAPGSRIGSTPSAPRPIVNLDIAAHPAKSAQLERRIA